MMNKMQQDMILYESFLTSENINIKICLLKGKGHTSLTQFVQPPHSKQKNHRDK